MNDRPAGPRPISAVSRSRDADRSTGVTDLFAIRVEYPENH